MIPLVLMEEHHEAFLVWHYAIMQKWMPGSFNVLLHVDEHSDWATPRLRRSIESAGETLAGIAEFTYAELDIGSFIWPAVYQGIFGEVHWMRTRHTIEATARRLFIRPLNEERTEFQTGLASGSGVGQTIVIHQMLTPDSIPSLSTPFVLNIDLDYFSSHAYPDYTGRRLEITRDAYEEFCADRYHFLKIAPGSKITAAHREGRYYFYFNCGPDDAEERPPTTTNAEIARRMDSFVHFLGACQAKPLLIQVCRSRHSGYTPRGQWQFIEDLLVGRLADLYSPKQYVMRDILEAIPAERSTESYVL